MSSIPELDHFSGSWIVVDKSTGLAVLETYSYKIAMKINQQRYNVLTAYDYLCRLNKAIKNKQHT